jgi:predicted HNH restriction endonuclease
MATRRSAVDFASNSDCFRQLWSSSFRISTAARSLEAPSGRNGCLLFVACRARATPRPEREDSFFELLVVNAEPLPRSAWGDNTADVEWQEGTPKLRSHLVKERASGLVSAKKRAFINQHGRLFCERCGTDPVQTYGTDAAESCIEVHHASTAVAEMGPNHRTKLSELQCLCANCHRLRHREMRDASP